ncbi:hypothetical protein EJB05_37656, partial [Eragrostis curvula]
MKPTQIITKWKRKTKQLLAAWLAKRPSRRAEPDLPGNQNQPAVIQPVRRRVPPAARALPISASTPFRKQRLFSSPLLRTEEAAHPNKTLRPRLSSSPLSHRPAIPASTRSFAAAETRRPLPRALSDRKVFR